jgi:hypothetical protein
VQGLRAVVFPVATVLAALAVAGCGSSKQSPTEAWANDLCKAVTTYKGALEDAATGVKSNLSKTGLQKAGDQAKSATDTFTSTVKGLGPPPTTAGQVVQDTLGDLQTELQKDAAAVQGATSSSSIVDAIATVSSTVATAKDQITSAVDKVKQSDPKGELEKAFKKADACKSLQNL